jgi:hypothetical protein
MWRTCIVSFKTRKGQKSYMVLPYPVEDFEKLEERFRSLLLLTALEMKEALEEDKRNYREALKSLLNK